MRILAWVHKYPPLHNAGAEWMLHSLLASSVERGHSCSVVARHGADPVELDGVRILGDGRKLGNVLALVDVADVVVTHLDVTREAVRITRRRSKPLVHLLHNHRQLTYHRLRAGDGTLVANSRWIAETVPATWPRPVVIHPPVDLERYRPVDGPHDRVVLSNMTAAKGAELFWQLARLLPDVRFLGVRGAYGHQLDTPTDGGAWPGNVEVIDASPDVVRDVYSRARVVLVPSSYESWGRVAVEASACGIPVCWAPTPGLVEAMGMAGIELPLERGQAWARAVRALVDDDSQHELFARVGQTRAAALDPRQAGGAFDTWDELLTSCGQHTPSVD